MRSGGTALSCAAANANVGVVRLLIAGSATIDVVGLHGKTPLHLAAEMKCQNKPSPTAATVAAERLHQFEVFYDDKYDGEKARYLACATQLLQAGADVNRKLNDDETALTRAVLYGHDAMARLLLAHGAHPDAVVAKPWRTAMTLATAKQDGPLVRALLDGGATATWQARALDCKYTLELANEARTIPAWTAARLELMMDALLNVLVDHPQVRLAPVSCVTGEAYLGLGVRTVGLLSLRCGAKPTGKLLEMLRSADGGGGRFPPGIYPVHQARVDPTDGFEHTSDAGNSYRSFPDGHHLRGTEDDGDCRLLELIAQRHAAAQAGIFAYPPTPDLGIGGDGHGVVEQIESLLCKLSLVEPYP